ncbi:MAG: hypothetical protein MK066_10710 [Crocinitomicaceae bacterium]|nr:hypothetical protein [Crocinitomicaceae bacterium]
MKLFAFITITTLLFSCGNMKKKSANSDNTETIKAALGDIVNADSDATSISSASIEGNILTLSLSYSGGCEKHVFDLLGSFSVMKSLPAKRSIKLIHNANGDKCRKLVEETIKFDISDLAVAKQSGSEIVLLLDGYKGGELSYIYK